MLIYARTIKSARPRPLVSAWRRDHVGVSGEAMSTQPGGEDAYIPLPSVEAATAGRPDDHPYNFGFVGGMGRLLMAHPRIGGPFQALFGAIMFAPGALDRQEREMIAAVTAAAQTCFY